MRILYIGNFEPPHSTENHVKRALEANGHHVDDVQENEPGAWRQMAKGAFPPDLDFIMWTRTGWDYSKLLYQNDYEARALQSQMLITAARLRIPTVAYHLDLFFGLGAKRVAVLDEPFFQCDVVITADGGHPVEFAARGINHTWFPPAVSEAECEPGMFRDEFRSPIAFVGSWQGGYHSEHAHRQELVQWLQANYARDCAFWPRPGHPAIRGADLRDLYASVDVVVGDSCFAGKVANYWSDRIPETLGRGGFLLHPYVEGLDDAFPVALPWTWRAGDWGDLGSQIEDALAMSRESRARRTGEARDYVLQRHTYEVRMRQLVALLQERELL